MKPSTPKPPSPEVRAARIVREIASCEKCKPLTRWQKNHMTYLLAHAISSAAVSADRRGRKGK